MHTGVLPSYLGSIPLGKSTSLEALQIPRGGKCPAGGAGRSVAADQRGIVAEGFTISFCYWFGAFLIVLVKSMKVQCN